MNPNSFENKPFNSTEEELSFLRERIAKMESDLVKQGEKISKEDIIREQIENYKKVPDEEALHRDFLISHREVEGIVLNLPPEKHDYVIEELITTLREKGIKNTLKVVERMKSPHVEDDFHRFLVEYLRSGKSVAGLEKGPMWKALNRRLFEISFEESNSSKDERVKSVKELVSKMEQFYSGLMSDNDTEEHWTIELANPYDSEETAFYVSVPKEKEDFFQKLLLSIFPKAKIIEKKSDFNIFNESGVSSGSFATFKAHEILPIKTYEQFDYDPLNLLLSAFSKIDKSGEGAAVQIVFKPAGDYYNKKFKKALDDLEKGKKKKDALDISYGLLDDLRKEIGFVFKHANKDEGKDKKDESPHIDSTLVENIKHKLETSIGDVNIRIISSAPSHLRAQAIEKDLEAAFGQFTDATANGVTFSNCEGKKLEALFRNFTYRNFSGSESMPMSIRELSSFSHFPSEAVVVNAQLKQSKAGTAPAPAGMPKEGILLGNNIHQGKQTPIYMTKEDRLRHFYVVGQTGTGKTTILNNMIIQDIENGEGVCMIDPHGSDVQTVLANIPKERYEDVIYFDPAYTELPMGLNMLEYDVRFPEQKTFVVDELLGIFQKLYGAIPESMGPAFEQYFRNSALLVMEHPESGNTMVDISRVLSDKSFRDLKVANCKNPLVTQFWINAEKTTGEQGLANYVQYVSNKFDNFLMNEIMRPIIAQEKSSFNFRDIMDNKKIFLVNLSKGRLGESNANLIGLILVGKFLMAALSRVDVVGTGKEVPPFYLYIDEFQNVTTNSITTILSEARKYKLSLTLAHQFIKQIDEKIKDSVFGNVGSMAVYRVGMEDAEFLVKQFEPIFETKDIINIDNFNCYLKLLVNGKPTKPFSLEAMPPRLGDPSNNESLKQMSYVKYGKDRATVDAMIMEKFKKSGLLRNGSTSV